MENTKKCPFCAEEINTDAIKCKHCQSDLLEKQNLDINIIDSKKQKKCKFCQTIIDKKAINCPNCKKDLRDFAGRHPIITIFLFLFIIGSIASNMNKDNSISNNSENINITENKNGIWNLGYYSDEFGNKTKETFIGTSNYINGTFSNTATENSNLKVEFLINNKDNIFIQLYEYGRNNPVKSIRDDYYTIKIQDKEGKQTELTAVNSSDRLKIKKSSILYDMLLKGGEIKVIIIKNDFPSQYYFSFNSDGFDNIIKEKK